MLLENDFTKEQQEQINMGKAAGLPVSYYSDNAYDPFQMEEIRKGLLHGVDVYYYTDPALSWDQMAQIRFGLEEGLDVTVYNDPSIPTDIMASMRITLKHTDKTLWFTIRQTLKSILPKEVLLYTCVMDILVAIGIIKFITNL